MGKTRRPGFDRTNYWDPRNAKTKIRGYAGDDAANHTIAGCGPCQTIWWDYITGIGVTCINYYQKGNIWLCVVGFLAEP